MQELPYLRQGGGLLLKVLPLAVASPRSAQIYGRAPHGTTAAAVAAMINKTDGTAVIPNYENEE